LRSPSGSSSESIANDNGRRKHDAFAGVFLFQAGLGTVTIALGRSQTTAALGEPGVWQRLKTNKNWLGFWFMLPTAVFLIAFLAYPLGLGVWLSFTDARLGRAGVFIGLENYEFLWEDSTFWLKVFNTLLYTIVASTIKFAVGLYLALLLNERLPFKAIIRAVVLVPFIVPTVLSAIAFWWLFDPQFSIISWSLKQMGLITTNIDFLGDPWNARWSVIFANIWRGVPFVAITLLAGLQTVSPSLYEAATIDGATTWQRFRYITYPLLTPIIAVVMTFSVLFTFTDFQLIWVMTRGGPVNATHLMATFSYQRAIMSGYLGEGAAISTAMIPFLLGAIMVSWFGLQKRKWQQGGDND
jgi:multiple sugar transport system permease protein